jgi:DNA invertase Pin-like site-specific DNA recombinase
MNSSVTQAAQEILPMPKRAYSYLRFSSPAQAKGDSRRRQEAFAEEIVRAEGALLDTSLSLNDFGKSAFRGNNAKKGALAVFVEAVETGRVSAGSILIIEQLDRLSRDQVGDHLQLFIRLLNAGIVIVTAEPRRRYTRKSVNDIATILEAIIHMARAHEESAVKSMRLRAVWSQKKKRASACA